MVFGVAVGVFVHGENHVRAGAEVDSGVETINRRGPVGGRPITAILGISTVPEPPLRCENDRRSENLIGEQGDRCIQGDCPAVREARPGVETDGGLRQNVAVELGSNTDRRRAANLPEDVAAKAVDNNFGIRRCSQRAADLEDENGVRVAQGVEVQISGKGGGSVEMIDTRSERLPAKIRSRQVIGRQKCLARQGVIGGNRVSPRVLGLGVVKADGS